MRVSAAGGNPVAVTKLGERESGHLQPTFLPDGRHFIFLIQDPLRAQIGSLDSQAREPLFDTDSRVDYSEPGHLSFVRQGTLMAQRFDARRRTLVGDPFRVVDNIGTNSTGRLAASTGLTGVVAYRTGGLSLSRQLVWFDRAGRQLSTVGDVKDIRGIALSPDGQRVALHVHEPAGGDVWVADTVRGTTSRFTCDATRHYAAPCWPSTGDRLIYTAIGNAGQLELLQRPSGGAGAEESLLKMPAANQNNPTDCTDTLIVFQRFDPKTQRDLWVLPLTGDRKPSVLFGGNYMEDMGRLSPDGRWIAYMSNETGRDEVYVQPFPPTSGKSQISSNGGSQPLWRADGKELFSWRATAS